MNADDYLESADKHLDEKNYDGAIADCTKAIQLEPDNSWAYSCRGSAYGRKKEFDLAIADHTEAIKLNPNFAEAYFDRGMAYSNKKDSIRSIIDYNDAIRLGLSNDHLTAVAYYNIGVAYHRERAYSSALQNFKKAYLLNPNDKDQERVKRAEYYCDRAGEWEQKRAEIAINDRIDAVKRQREREERERREREERERKEQERREQEERERKEREHREREERERKERQEREKRAAIEKYTEELRSNPNSASAYYNRGVVYRESNEYNQAFNDFEKAVNLESGNSNYREALKEIEKVPEIKEIKLKRAIEKYTEELRSNPNSASAYYNRGAAYRESNEYNQAFNDFEKAVNLEPDNATYREALEKEQERKERQEREKREREELERKKRKRQKIKAVALILKIVVLGVIFAYYFSQLSLVPDDGYMGGIPEGSPGWLLFLVERVEVEESFWWAIFTMGLPVGISSILIGIIGIVLKSGSGTFIVPISAIIAAIVYAITSANGFWGFIGYLILFVIANAVFAVPGFLMSVLGLHRAD